jgi:hypothetical protein
VPDADSEPIVEWEFDRRALASLLDGSEWHQEPPLAQAYLLEGDIDGNLNLVEIVDRLFYEADARLDRHVASSAPGRLVRFDGKLSDSRSAGRILADTGPADASEEVDAVLDEVATWVESFGRPADLRRVLLSNVGVNDRSAYFSTRRVAPLGLLRRAVEIADQDPDRAARYARAAITLSATFAAGFSGPEFGHYAADPNLMRTGRWPYLRTDSTPYLGIDWNLNQGVRMIARLALPDDREGAAELERSLRLYVILQLLSHPHASPNLVVVHDATDQFRLFEMNRAENEPKVMRLPRERREGVEASLEKLTTHLPMDMAEFALQIIQPAGELREWARVYDDQETVAMIDRILNATASRVISESTRRWLQEAQREGQERQTRLVVPENMEQLQ